MARTSHYRAANVIIQALLLQTILQPGAEASLSSFSLLPKYRPFQNTAHYTPTSVVQRQLNDEAFGTCRNIGLQACGQSCIPADARCCDNFVGDFCDSGYYCTKSGCCLDGRDCADEPAPTCWGADNPRCPSSSGCCPSERPICVKRQDNTEVCQDNPVLSLSTSSADGISAKTDATPSKTEGEPESIATSIDDGSDGDMVILVTSSSTSNNITPVSTTESGSQKLGISGGKLSVMTVVILSALLFNS